MESTQYDALYGIFKVNSEFSIPKQDPTAQLDIRENFYEQEVSNGISTQKVQRKLYAKFKAQLLTYLSQDLQPQSFDWEETFKMMNNIGQMDISNRFGYLFVPFGNCLVILNQSQILEAFQNNKDINEIKPRYFKVTIDYQQMQLFQVPGIIKFIRISNFTADKWMALQINDEVQFFSTVAILKELSKNNSNGSQIPEYCLIVLNSKQFMKVDMLQGEKKDFNGEVNSAIFNKAHSHILVASTGINKNIQVLDINDLKELTYLTFTFPADCKHDKFRFLWLNEYVDDHLIIGATGFEDQGKIDENYGFLMDWWIGMDIGPQTTAKEITDKKRVKFYYQMEQQHQSDDDPPAFKLVTIKAANQITGILAISHLEEPHYFHIGNNELTKFYEFFAQKHLANRPVGVDQLQYLGTFQGLCLVEMRFRQNPAEFQFVLPDETINIKYPPQAIYCGIDGTASIIKIIPKDIEKIDILRDTEDLPVNDSIVKEEVKKEDKKVEESKAQPLVTAPLGQINTFANIPKANLQLFTKVEQPQPSAVQENKILGGIQKEPQQQNNMFQQLNINDTKQQPMPQNNNLFGNILPKTQNMIQQPNAQPLPQAMAKTQALQQQPQPIQQQQIQPVQQQQQPQIKTQDNVIALSLVLQKLDQEFDQKYPKTVIQAMRFMAIEMFPNLNKLVKKCEQEEIKVDFIKKVFDSLQETKQQKKPFEQTSEVQKLKQAIQDQIQMIKQNTVQKAQLKEIEQKLAQDHSMSKYVPDQTISLWDQFENGMPFMTNKMDLNNQQQNLLKKAFNTQKNCKTQIKQAESFTDLKMSTINKITQQFIRNKINLDLNSARINIQAKPDRKSKLSAVPLSSLNQPKQFNPSQVASIYFNEKQISLVSAISTAQYKIEESQRQNKQTSSKFDFSDLNDDNYYPDITQQQQETMIYLQEQQQFRKINAQKDFNRGKRFMQNLMSVNEKVQEVKISSKGPIKEITKPKDIDFQRYLQMNVVDEKEREQFFQQSDNLLLSSPLPQKSHTLGKNFFNKGISISTTPLLHDNKQIAGNSTPSKEGDYFNGIPSPQSKGSDELDRNRSDLIKTKSVKSKSSSISIGKEFFGGSQYYLPQVEEQKDEDEKQTQAQTSKSKPSLFGQKADSTLKPSGNLFGAPEKTTINQQAPIKQSPATLPLLTNQEKTQLSSLFTQPPTAAFKDQNALKSLSVDKGLIGQTQNETQSKDQLSKVQNINLGQKSDLTIKSSEGSEKISLPLMGLSIGDKKEETKSSSLFGQDQNAPKANDSKKEIMQPVTVKKEEPLKQAQEQTKADTQKVGSLSGLSSGFGTSGMAGTQSSLLQNQNKLFGAAQIDNKGFGSFDAAKIAAQQKMGGAAPSDGKVFGAGTSLQSNEQALKPMTFSSFSNQSKPQDQQNKTQPATFGTFSNQQPNIPQQNQPNFQQPTSFFQGGGIAFSENKPLQQQQMPGGFGGQQQQNQFGQQQQQPGSLFGQQNALFGGQQLQTNFGQGFGGQQQQLGFGGPQGFPGQAAFGGQQPNMFGNQQIGYGGQQNEVDFGTGLAGGGNVGFAGSGPNLDQAKDKYSNPAFMKLRKQ